MRKLVLCRPTTYQTIYGGHEVFEAQTDGVSGDCCDGETSSGGPFPWCASCGPYNGGTGACGKYEPAAASERWVRHDFVRRPHVQIPARVSVPARVRWHLPRDHPEGIDHGMELRRQRVRRSSVLDMLGRQSPRVRLGQPRHHPTLQWTRLQGERDWHKRSVLPSVARLELRKQPRDERTSVLDMQRWEHPQVRRGDVDRARVLARLQGERAKHRRRVQLMGRRASKRTRFAVDSAPQFHAHLSPFS